MILTEDKTLPHLRCIHHKSHIDWSRIENSLHCKRSVTNNHSHDTDFLIVLRWPKQQKKVSSCLKMKALRVYCNDQSLNITQKKNQYLWLFRKSYKSQINYVDKRGIILCFCWRIAQLPLGCEQPVLWFWEYHYPGRLRTTYLLFHYSSVSYFFSASLTSPAEETTKRTLETNKKIPNWWVTYSVVTWWLIMFNFLSFPV